MSLFECIWLKTLTIMVVMMLILFAVVDEVPYLTFKQRGNGGPGKRGEAASTESVDTSTWKTYRNKEYGFELKYPPEGSGSPNWSCDRPSESSPEASILFCLEIFYSYQEPPFQHQPFNFNLDLSTAPICTARFFVNIIEDPLFPPLEELTRIYGKSKFITVNGTKGLRRNESVTRPPGGGGAQDLVYLPRGSHIYLISYIVDKEVLANDKNAQTCLNEQAKIFDQMLSTFDFITKGATSEL